MSSFSIMYYDNTFRFFNRLSVVYDCLSPLRNFAQEVDKVSSGNYFERQMTFSFIQVGTRNIVYREQVNN